MLRAKGTGTIEIRLGNKTAQPAATIDFESSAYKDFTVELDPATFTGVKTMYIVCTSATNVYLDAWQFMHDVPDAISTVRVSPQPAEAATYDLTGQRANTRTARRGVYIQNGKKVVVK